MLYEIENVFTSGFRGRECSLHPDALMVFSLYHFEHFLRNRGLVLLPLYFFPCLLKFLHADLPVLWQKKKTDFTIFLQ